MPVMADEVIEMLAPAPGSLQIDATVGGGGHTERILEAADPDGRVLGLDADGAAIARSREPLARFGDRLVLRQANFRELADGRARRGLRAVDGCLFDLGLSQLPARRPRSRLRVPGRRPAGHALRHDARRPGGRADRDARRRRAGRPLPPLRRGAVRRAGSRGRSSPNARRAPIATAEELAALVERVAPPSPRERRRDPPGDARVPGAADRRQRGARRPVQAGLAAAVDLLRPGGRLVVLSYHSLEDRIVKRFLAAERRGCACPPEVPVCVCGRNPRLRLVDRPRDPDAAEIAANPRARSARLRAAERLAA